MTTVRARFAPSPTGALHVGSARTALLNWLYVHATGGSLLLRFDDSDPARSDAALEPAIEDDLRWLGLSWDEGPVRQSERLARYAEALAALPVTRRDGAYEFESRVIARADGSPLYHLATAVDDIDDRITHVLRGRDHLPNTELQVAIIRALGGEPPQYVHAPLLVFEDGGKLSKRAGDALTVSGLRAAGFPAGAVCNALALSLADFGTEEVMLTADEIAARFDVDRLHSADSHFDEAKLRWLSGQHIRALGSDRLAAELADRGLTDLPEAAVLAAQTGGETLEEVARVARGIVIPPPPDDEAIAAIDRTEVGLAWAELDELISEWPPTIEQAKSAVEQLKRQMRSDGYDVGVCLRGIRAVLTGRTEGVELALLLACVSASRWDAAGYYSA